MEPENSFETAGGQAAAEAEPTQEIGGAVTEIPQNTDEARAYVEQTAAADKKQAEMEEQDKKLLAALDEVLEKRSRRMREEQKESVPRVRQLAKSAVKKGVGFISLGLILMFLGIVMVCCLFSPAPNFLLPLKLSPICAVLIGVEILFSQVMTRGNFKINIPSVLISALLVVGCCVMCVSLNNSYKEEKEEYNNRSIAAEIYDRSYKELRYVADIASLEIEVDLNPDGSGRYKGIEALSTDDYVNIKLKFAGSFNSPRAFAVDCKKIIDGYRIMGINVTNFFFENSSARHSFSLSVEGRFLQDYTESRLEELVNYIYIEDYDFLGDLNDLEDETKDI